LNFAISHSQLEYDFSAAGDVTTPWLQGVFHLLVIALDVVTPAVGNKRPATTDGTEQKLVCWTLTIALQLMTEAFLQIPSWVLSDTLSHHNCI
jgi:hypothetical protein